MYSVMAQKKIKNYLLKNITNIDGLQNDTPKKQEQSKNKQRRKQFFSKRLYLLKQTWSFEQKYDK